MPVPQELQDEFPGEVALITRLAKTNYPFRRVASRYDEINRQIYRPELEDEPAADQILERLKKQRLKLKDQVALMLTRVEHRM